MKAPVRRLNYQHLLYFWAVVRTGSLTAACEELSLSAPTVSAQLRTFEQRLGEKLLVKSGRTLVPTAMGRLVFSYADEIFRLGNDLVNAVAQRPTSRPVRLVVGVDDVVPKSIVQRLLGAAFDAVANIQLICREGTLDHLVNALRAHELDAVISDSPVTPTLGQQLYNHRLGSCGQSWMAAPALGRKLRKRFPRSLHGAPILLPTTDTAIRRALDQWLERHRVRPILVAELEDYALLREFAAAGTGVAPVPDVLEEQYRNESGLLTLGRVSGIETEFYLLSTERELRHSALAAIHQSAAKALDS
jgi:LysR family transcriptional activator of nhaA